MSKAVFRAVTNWILSIDKNCLLVKFALIICVGSVSLSKSDRYQPYTEGWWSTYANLMRSGLIPYKDFELLTPPGFVYITRFVEGIVGTNFLSLRYFGSFVQIAIALLIFRIFVKKTTLFIAFIAALFSNLYLYSNVASITFDYNYFAILMLLIGFNIYDSDRHLDSRIDFYLKYLSGLFFGFSFLIKQSFAVTTVMFLVAGSLASTALWRRTKIKRNLLGALSFLIGFITPVTCFALYALQGHFLNPFLQNVFQGSVQAKGNPLTVLFGWVPNSWRYFEIHGDFSKNYILATSFVFLYQFLKYMRGKRIREIDQTLKALDKALLLFAGVVFIASLRDMHFGVSNTNLKSIIQNAPAFPILGDHPIIPLFFAIGWLFLVFSNVRKEFINIFGLVLGIVWACALSGGVDQYGMFLALGMMLVLLSNYAKEKTLLIPVSVLLLAIWIAGFNSSWISSPYSWWGYRTPTVSDAKVSSVHPYSKGLYSDYHSNLRYSELIELANLNRKCSKVMLTFPSMTSFSLDAEYTPYLNQVQYWYDFTSGEKIKTAIRSISSNPPPAILYTKYPVGVAQAHSKGFNQSKPFPQQDLERKIVKLIQKEYVSKSYDLSNSDGHSVTLAIKKSCL